jgi:hypothetical protein
MQGVVVLSVVMLSNIMQGVVMLSVVIVSVEASEQLNKHRRRCTCLFGLIVVKLLKC